MKPINETLIRAFSSDRARDEKWLSALPETFDTAGAARAWGFSHNEIASIRLSLLRAAGLVEVVERGNRYALYRKTKEE